MNRNFHIYSIFNPIGLFALIFINNDNLLALCILIVLLLMNFDLIRINKNY